jgi:hypothetical protein
MARRDAHLVPMCRIFVVEETETLMESIKKYIEYSNHALQGFKRVELGFILQDF